MERINDSVFFYIYFTTVINKSTFMNITVINDREGVDKKTVHINEVSHCLILFLHV